MPERLFLDGLISMLHIGEVGTAKPHARIEEMIKSELIQMIADKNPHLYQRDVENIVNAILGEITDALANGDRVELRGFGAFSVKNRQPRSGEKPQDR